MLKSICLLKRWVFASVMSAVPVLGSVGNPGPQSPESKSQTNLIVNYIPPSMSEEDVRSLFVSIGPVQSCKLIKDKQNEMSLGYAFVNYTNAEHAEKSIQRLNGLPLQGKTIKVSYARPSSSKNANVYVAYLPKTINQDDLEAMFCPYGTIITSKILIDPATKRSRGVGFVRFDTHIEAESSILKLNGQQLPGSEQPLVVKFANQAKTSSNIGPVATAVQLNGMAVHSRRINPMLSPSGAGGPMRHSLASNVRFNPVLVGSGLPGLPVSAINTVAAPTPASVGLQGSCVFVYNLPEDAQDTLLYQLFSPFGAITSVSIIRGKDGVCKRYGFVNMVNCEDAYSAISALNGFLVDGKQLQVSFKKAQD